MTLSIKFCGLTNLDDLTVACSLGVDAVGLVYYPPSPRYVDIDSAKRLASSVPAFISVVVLVVNIEKLELIKLTHDVPFDIIQFHGDETAIQCADLANTVYKRWIKAIRVAESMTTDDILLQIIELAKYGASGVILDAYHPKQYGGTGETFDWCKIPENSPLPIYLAGGLTPENVGMIANSKLACRIAGVDVSGGIEVEKGVKDSKKMKDFVNAIMGK